MPQIGDQAPAFALPTDNEDSFTVPADKPLVLYFYPRDDTPGCTTEAKDFSELGDDFARLGLRIVGVSPDSADKHAKFRAKHGLNVTLVADEQKKALEAYGVWMEKKMYGKTFMGVERATFLIDADGKIVALWRKVKAKGHAAAVLSAAREHFS